MICNMAPPGTPLGPALDALVAACRGHYGARIMAVTSPGLLSLDSSSLLRIKSADTMRVLPRVMPDRVTGQEVRQRGGAMLECLSAREADVFILGDAAAFRLASQIALWSRECQTACRWIALPACPYNSVPFTAASIGFGSAVRWCSSLAAALHDERRRDLHGAPVAILEIAGDTTGWLAAGSAALAGSPSEPVFCITPDMAVAADALCATLGRAVTTHGCALLVTSAVAHTAAGHCLAVPGVSVGIALHQMLTAHGGLDATVTSICPADMFDPAYVSARDMADSRAMARAAVRAARKAEPCALMLRRAADAAGRHLIHTVSLLEATDIPRTLPRPYINSRGYKPLPLLRDHLMCFAQG